MNSLNTKPVAVVPARREIYPSDRPQAGHGEIDVSVILPTFNEKQNLEILFPRLLAVLEGTGRKYEILVVDDNSTDGTWQMVRDISLRDNRFRMIRRIDEKGLSSAVVVGMASACGARFVVMDADLQHDEGIVPAMIDLLMDHDIVVGSRMIDGGSYGGMMPLRRVMSRSATYLAGLLLDVRITDPMSGFFAVRREVFEKVVRRLNPRGFKILLEIAAGAGGARIAELGYRFGSRVHGRTKLSASVVLDYLFALLEIRLKRPISLEAFKYAVIGAIGVPVNLLGQVLSTLLFGWSYSEESLLWPSMAVLTGFELSVLFNYFANNTWTFKSHRREGLQANLAGLGRFHIVAVYGFVIQLSIWNLFTGMLVRMFGASVSPGNLSYFANLLGILFAAANNFYLNRNFTWNRSGLRARLPAAPRVRSLAQNG